MTNESRKKVNDIIRETSLDIEFYTCVGSKPIKEETEKKTCVSLGFQGLDGDRFRFYTTDSGVEFYCDGGKDTETLISLFEVIASGLRKEIEENTMKAKSI